MSIRKEPVCTATQGKRTQLLPANNRSRSVHWQQNIFFEAEPRSSLVAVEPPQVLLPWEQGIFRDIFADRPLECSFSTSKAPVDHIHTAQASEVDASTLPTTGRTAQALRGEHSAKVTL